MAFVALVELFRGGLVFGFNAHGESRGSLSDKAEICLSRVLLRPVHLEFSSGAEPAYRHDSGLHHSPDVALRALKARHTNRCWRPQVRVLLGPLFWDVRYASAIASRHARRITGSAAWTQASPSAMASLAR